MGFRNRHNGFFFGTGVAQYKRPPITVEIRRCERSEWSKFRKYHYLNTELNNSSQCFGAYINNRIVGFCAVVHFPHPRNPKIKRVHRLVVLPDYQGIGIGSRLNDFVAEHFYKLGFDVRIVTSTPALVYGFKNSKRWSLIFAGQQTSRVKGLLLFNRSMSFNRMTTSWRFLG